MHGHMNTKYLLALTSKNGHVVSKRRMERAGRKPICAHS